MKVYFIVNDEKYDKKVKQDGVETYFASHECTDEESARLMSEIGRYEVLKTKTYSLNWDDPELDDEYSEEKELIAVPLDRVAVRDGHFAGFIFDLKIVSAQGVGSSTFSIPVFIEVGAEPRAVFSEWHNSDDSDRGQEELYKIVEKGSVIL